MKKNNVKAFTLVEMLIVIVIIGILIASLMPRMQSAQGRARDVARKNDLAQIQTAIITSQQDRGAYPGMEGDSTSGADGMDIKDISSALTRAGMSSVPADPNKSNVVKGLGLSGTSAKSYTAGQYAYMVTTRNGIANGGFALMAKTEVEGGSNWVVCNSGTDLEHGVIEAGTDLKDIKLCTEFTFNEDSADGACTTKKDNTDGKCVYNDINELAYILMY